MTIMIIHGSEGSPERDWLPWLKQKLEAEGQKVIAPKFPTPEGENLNNWMKVFDKYNDYFDENLIIVAHSLGCLAVLKKLHILDKPIKACFFVSGFLRRVRGDSEILHKTFYEPKQGFNWGRIKQNSKQFHVYISDDDTTVPPSATKELADKLDVKPTIVKGAGHFSQDEGVLEFPLLLEDIKKIL